VTRDEPAKATAATFGPYPGRVLDFHDGDTAHITLDLGFGVILAAYDIDSKPVTSCRVYGIDAPELATEEGKQALAFAVHACPPGSRVTVLSHGWDKYAGRFDGTITLADGQDFATVMMGAGHARPYFGKGPKPW
jgi:endonuclease YncB( thermonuclease family)